MALFVLLVLFLSLSCYGVEGRNKIQPTNVNEFDCVDIYKQPALDHPLLKNHKIQMHPSFSSKLMKKDRSELSFVKYSNFEFPSEACPPGMVPVQKSRINDQANLGNIHPLTDERPGNHFATFRTVKPGPFYGASADIDLQNPHVEMNQLSMAQIWLQSGPPAELNSIQVGWGVHPRIYGDNRTRLTTVWTADNFQKTGCYNLLCPGFVQVHSSLHLGAYYNDTSVSGGPQFVTKPTVLQDKATGNWWLNFDQGITMGYWPKEIFTHLSTGASFVQFGGWTFNSPDGLSPPMGSGLFSSRDTTKSCWFGQIRVSVKYGQLDAGVPMELFFDESKCYDIIYWGDQGGSLGESFSFGGPGGRCGI